MDTCRDLLWPWPGVADDFTTIWAHIKSMGSNLWDLEFSAATDDLLAIARLLAAAGGRLWGWFALAAIIIGGIWGGVFGTAGGPAGTGAGSSQAPLPAWLWPPKSVTACLSRPWPPRDYTSSNPTRTPRTKTAATKKKSATVRSSPRAPSS